MNTVQEQIARILELAAKNDISINKMLENCKLNKSVIDCMKKGSMPSFDKIVTIAQYFNVSVDYLAGRTGDPTPPDANSSQPILDADEKTLINFFRQMDAKNKAYALQQMEHVVRVSVIDRLIMDYYVQGRVMAFGGEDKAAQITDETLKLIVEYENSKGNRKNADAAKAREDKV